MNVKRTTIKRVLSEWRRNLMEDDNGRLSLTLDQVELLVATQFPHLSHLPLREISPQGWDNATFRLGDDLSVRIPMAQCYGSQPLKEQRWLSFLASYLAVKIPHQIALGTPSGSVPWHWSVCVWHEGNPLTQVFLSQEERRNFAYDLSFFLTQLHQIEAVKGPGAGLHNFWRGGALSHYDAEVKEALSALTLPFSHKLIEKMWEQALASSWEGPPRWVHGDMSVGNVLFKEGRLSAVIDFGCMGVGDPACDLVMAWTYFNKDEAALFQKELSLDADTWRRAKGWALWKALVLLNGSQRKIPGVNPLLILENLMKSNII